MEYVQLHNGTFAYLIVISMIADGSCLFRSIAYHVYSNPDLHLQVRQDIVNHVVSHWDDFKVQTHDQNGNNYFDKDTYYKSMIKKETFGSACEINAASSIFSYKFEIYHNKKFVYSFGKGPSKKLKFSGNLGFGHYDVYIDPKSDSEKILFSTSRSPSLRNTNDKRKILSSSDEDQVKSKENTTKRRSG